MTNAQLKMLWKIPEPINFKEFSKRTGKTEVAVRRMIERRQLPLITEREVLGERGSSRRFLILWNEWSEMVYEATRELPPERFDWKIKWLKKSKKLEAEFNSSIDSSSQN
ncbi:regulatory phage cox family protein [Citrobacter portucalensis]|uniref:Cox family DNA-binding protein n=1 Tax=Citrobacter portucalensis TaxID=1639133 RepID=UPI00226B0431|nr:Cox family DNA-binding protein [Citrobacter portucalensis]MCX9061127.1 regulatory phage cox family protein [Citrobacter portucalensis]